MSWNREPLLENELDSLLKAADDLDLEHTVTVRTIVHTGLRADEFAHLTHDWIDWQGEALRVPAFDECCCSNCKVDADERGIDLEDMWQPTTEQSVRTIPVKQPETTRTLRRYFSHHDAIGVTRQTIANRIDRAARAADLQTPVTPHVLRHTYGTILAARGATPQYIRQTMGHADRSSANRYLQYAGAQVDAEAEELWG